MSGALRGGRGPSLIEVLSRLLPGAALALAFAAVGIVHVSARVLVVDAGYKLSKLEQKNRELTREHDTLKLELATLKSPARLEQLARSRLGMVPPPAGAVVSVGPAAPRLGRGRRVDDRPGRKQTLRFANAGSEAP